MKIDRIIVGDYQTNCYVLTIDNDALIIDPGDEYLKIKPFVKNKNLLGVLITHYHFDHIGALDYFKDYNVYDIHNLEEKEYKLNKFIFDVIYTKGHKEDAITFYFKNEKIMFTGDFIFEDSIGRIDLPGGDIGEMLNSLNKIKKYDDDIIIYPGHGDSTILGKEKINFNYYF